MIFSLGEAILFAALLVTSLQILRMRRELHRLRAYHAEFQQVFGKTETALSAIQAAIRELQAGGRDMVEELGQRIEAGGRLAGELKRMGIGPDAPRPAGRNAQAA